jgi:hypothetical protein
VRAVPLVTELDLPEIDLTDPSLGGERWHETMRELQRSGSWLGGGPFGSGVLREDLIKIHQKRHE